MTSVKAGSAERHASPDTRVNLTSQSMQAADIGPILTQINRKLDPIPQKLTNDSQEFSFRQMAQTRINRINLINQKNLSKLSRNGGG